MIFNNNNTSTINLNSDKLSHDQKKRIEKFKERSRNDPTFNFGGQILLNHPFAFRDDIILEFSELFFKFPTISQLTFEQQSKIYDVMTGLLSRTYNQNYLENLESVISNPLNPKYKSLKKFFEKNKIFLDSAEKDFGSKMFPSTHFSFTLRSISTGFMFSIIKTSLIFLEKLNINETNFESVLQEFFDFTEKLKVGILTCSKIINIDMLPEEEMETAFENQETRNLYVYHFNKEIAFRNSIDSQHNNFGAYVWKLNGDEKYWKQILPFCFESTVALSSFTNSFTFNNKNKPLTYWLDSQVLAGMNQNKQWTRMPQSANKIEQEEGNSDKTRIILNHHNGLTTQECLVLRQTLASIQPTKFASDRKVLPIESINPNQNSPDIVLEKEDVDYSALIDYENLITTKPKLLK